MADENKRLIPMTIAHTDDNNWRITVDGEDSYFVKADIEDIKKVCRRIKAKDGEGHGKCRSSKVGTYLSMISADDNEEHKINVWKSRVPHTSEDFKKLLESKTTDEQIRLDGVSDNVEYYIGVYEENGELSKVQQKDLYDNLEILWVNNSYKYIYNLGVEVLNKCGYKNKLDLMESKEMKTITLTKNYIVEGLIVPKGTVITLKEKLDFLSAEIWDKAQEITDEHERFEFIKAELNKLGTNYNDDEIEDFINKYKTELNESLKEKEVDGLDDMMDMIEETLESEDYVAKENFKKVLDIAKKDEELLEAWEAMSTADDKTFVKKENDFWNRFDKICKPFKK